MIFKTTTIMACMLVSEMDVSPGSQSAAAAPTQALTVTIPAEWKLETLIDGAHLTEPKIHKQGREIVVKFEPKAPDFTDTETRGDTRFHITEFTGPDASDYVLTAWREMADGWLVLRAFDQNRNGRPGFSEAWTIFDSVQTA